MLPARIPNLLVNGATGIAVGMATNIPPHNLSEVCTALVKLLDNEEMSNAQLCRYVKGPDFPTGGQILNSQEELKEIYKTGIGIDPAARHLGHRPGDALDQDDLHRQHALHRQQGAAGRADRRRRDRPQAAAAARRQGSVDRGRAHRDRDEEGRRREDDHGVPLQAHAAADQLRRQPDLPDSDRQNPEVGRPERLDLKQILWHFLHFRLEVVTKRLEHELAALKKRIHILEGFEKVFDALDEIIRIIRKSDGKADAAEKIMKRFELDAEQTDAILELKIYRLARLEILIIRNELEEKRKRARQIGALLKDEESRWKLVRTELEEISSKYGDKRRTAIASDTGEPEYSADDFIVEEDNVVIVSRDGWVKRQKEVKDLSTTRLREGDAVLAAFAGSTRATCVFFTNFGVAYTCRIIDVPASTGYGEPIQRLFKLKDGEKVVAAMSLDPRVAGDIAPKKEGDAGAGARRRGLERRLRAALQPRRLRRAEHARRPALRAAGRGRRGRRRRAAHRRRDPDRRDARKRAASSAGPTRSTSCRARARA